MIPSVSNIAWPVADDEAAYEMLRDLDISYLEVAPRRWWPDLFAVTEKEVRAKADELMDRGFTACAFQGLHFGRPQLQLFGPDGGRDMIDDTKRACTIASWLGARALVFGSPKNRLRGELPIEEANELAIAAFRELGDHCVEHHVVLCLEPNPAGYGGDFLTTAPEVIALVKAINSPGIAMNFDMGEVIMNGENADQLIHAALPMIGHFHVSEPMLEPFTRTRPEHLQAARTLRALHYEGIVSVEMKTPTGGLAAVREAILAIQHVYEC